MNKEKLKQENAELFNLALKLFGALNLCRPFASTNKDTLDKINKEASEFINKHVDEIIKAQKI